MQTLATAKNLNISASKLRLGADLVRGQRVIDAENVLSATPKKAAVIVQAALKSAVANAENNYNIRKSALMITEIRVDEGPKLKRFRPRSRGSAAPILHRKAHLTIIVSDAVPVAKKSEKKANKTSTASKPKAPAAKKEDK